MNSDIVRETEITSGNIMDINIEWRYGKVIINPIEGDKIIITERVSGKVSEDELLDINGKDGVLNIIQKKYRNYIFSFGFTKNIVNEIGLPKNKYDKIRLNFSSGSLVVKDIKTEIFDCKLTSGVVNIENLKTADLLLNMTSGKSVIDGEFKNIDIKTTSGSVKVTDHIVPETIDAQLTSGTMTTVIPENEGFVIGKKKTSGVFKCNFDIDDFGRYKDGSREYKVKITSGVFKLLKL